MQTPLSKWPIPERRSGMPGRNATDSLASLEREAAKGAGEPRHFQPQPAAVPGFRYPSIEPIMPYIVDTSATARKATIPPRTRPKMGVIRPVMADVRSSASMP